MTAEEIAAIRARCDAANAQIVLSDEVDAAEAALDAARSCMVQMEAVYDANIAERDALRQRAEVAEAERDALSRLKRTR